MWKIMELLPQLIDVNTLLSQPQSYLYVYVLMKQQFEGATESHFLCSSYQMEHFLFHSSNEIC